MHAHYNLTIFNPDPDMPDVKFSFAGTLEDFKRFVIDTGVHPSSGYVRGETDDGRRFNSDLSLDDGERNHMAFIDHVLVICRLDVLLDTATVTVRREYEDAEGGRDTGELATMSLREVAAVKRDFRKDSAWSTADDFYPMWCVRLPGSDREVTFDFALLKAAFAYHGVAA